MKVIEGGVTAAQGFLAAGLSAGIKKGNTKDMAMLYSKVPCEAAGTFTTNIVKAAPVKWDQKIVYESEKAQAVICNSGIANACTGEEGFGCCKETAKAASLALNIPEDSVLVASTGVIGQQIPIEKIKKGIENMAPLLSESISAGTLAAEAIMTTDTVKKEIAVEVEIGGKNVTVGGMCKGSGMIHPNMCTMLGFITTDLMKENFPDIVDVDFTAHMEDEIEDVADGTVSWKEIIRQFYGPFKKTLDEAEEKIGNVEIKDEESDVVCEKCGRKMVYKQGRFGKFLACPGFPECRNTKAIVNTIDAKCPKCGGKVIVRKSKKGVTFYTCENSPECDFISWNEPTDEKCPKCGNSLMKVRAFKGRGPLSYKCFNEECDYETKPSSAKK